MRAGRQLFIVYAYNIESPLARWWQTPKVLARDGDKFMPIVPIHRRLRGLYTPRGPGLNLNKTNHIATPSDQVNLSLATRGSEVARHHGVAQLPKVEVRSSSPRVPVG